MGIIASCLPVFSFLCLKCRKNRLICRKTSGSRFLDFLDFHWLTTEFVWAKNSTVRSQWESRLSLFSSLPVQKECLGSKEKWLNRAQNLFSHNGWIWVFKKLEFNDDLINANLYLWEKNAQKSVGRKTGFSKKIKSL
jgi:hypothetical protein